MLTKDLSIAVVIPCFRVSKHVLNVLNNIPACITNIYCVDDACPEHSGKLIEEKCIDTRVSVIFHQTNLGVGGAMVSGYKQALKDNADIIVKIDGDGQMDPQLIPHFIRPIIENKADYTKGNRFFQLHDFEDMPKARILGNTSLTLLNKLSTGYWRLFDPTNGFTAIHSNVLQILPLDKLHQRYFFESDMLYRLSTVRAVVLDIPQKAIYGQETSGVSIIKNVPIFALKHLRNFTSRIFYTYFLRDFHLASIEWLVGPILFLFGLIFGVYNWHESIQLQREATAGTVMLSALTFISGLQLILSAIHFDIDNQPTTPIHTFLTKSTMLESSPSSSDQHH